MTAIPADNNLAARQLVRSRRKAALATLDKDGAPYVSLVTYGVDHDLAPLLIVSAMSAHTRNMERDPRVSFLFDGSEGFANPQEGPRFSLSGKAIKGEDSRLRTRFLALQPAAKMYAGFGDFSLWRVEPERGQLIGGFGRANWINAPFGLSPDCIAAFEAGEDQALVRLAEAGRADIVRIDPDGYATAIDDRVEWQAFVTPAGTPDDAISLILTP